MAPQRIGILGGTFDPIHLGHLIPAQYAFGHLRLDRLYLVPAAAPVHRPHHTPASPEHRLRMCELAVRHLPPFAVSDCEVRRPEPSYTVLTLEHFARTAGPDATIFLLLGEDNLPLLPAWRRIADIVALATLAILPRPIKPPASRGDALPSPASRGDALPPAVPSESQNLKSAIRIPSPLVPTSASDIRRRIREGLSIAGLVPASVLTYIQEHHLYQT